MAYYVANVRPENPTSNWDGVVLRLGDATSTEEVTLASNSTRNLYPTGASSLSSQEGIFFTSCGNLIIRAGDSAYEEFTGLNEIVSGDTSSHKTHVKSGDVNITLNGHSQWTSETGITVESTDGNLTINVPHGEAGFTSNTHTQEAYFNLTHIKGYLRTEIHNLNDSYTIGPVIALHAAGTLGYKYFAIKVKPITINWKTLYCSAGGLTVGIFFGEGRTLTTDYSTICLWYVKFRYFQLESGIKSQLLAPTDNITGYISFRTAAAFSKQRGVEGGFGLRSKIPG